MFCWRGKKNNISEWGSEYQEPMNYNAMLRRSKIGCLSTKSPNKIYWIIVAVWSSGMQFTIALSHSYQLYITNLLFQYYLQYQEYFAEQIKETLYRGKNYFRQKTQKSLFLPYIWYGKAISFCWCITLA